MECPRVLPGPNTDRTKIEMGPNVRRLVAFARTEAMTASSRVASQPAINEVYTL